MDLKFLTQKKGPLPVWAWAAITAVGLFLIYKLYKNKSGGSSSSSSITPTTDATPPVDNSFPPYGISGGGDSGGGGSPETLGPGFGLTDSGPPIGTDTSGGQSVDTVAQLPAQSPTTVDQGNNAPSPEPSTITHTAQQIAARLGYDIPAGATNLQILKNGAITFVGPGGKSRLEIAAPGKTAYKIGTVGAAAKATAAKTTAKVAAPIAKPKSQVIKKAVPAPVKQPSPPKLTRQKNKAQVKKNSF